MKKFTILSVLPFILFACNKLPVGPTANCTGYSWDSSSKHPKKTEYQALIDKYTAKGLPGIILLIHDSNGVWMGSSGKADIQKGIDMQPCMVSATASVTKMMISTLVMRLVEQGRLQLDRAVSQYLPDDQIKNIENASNATLRQLLNHTSGIYDVIADNDFYLNVLNNGNKTWTTADLMKVMEGKPATFQLGSGVSYSNGNYVLIAAIIERITQKDHGELLKSLVFDKAGNMNHTYYYRYDQIPDYTAQGYYDLFNNGSLCNLSNWDVGNGNGYTGVFSTVYDMMNFIEALLVNKTILKQSSLDEMLTFNAVEEETTRSLGLGIMKDYFKTSNAPYTGTTHFAYGHRGRTLGYSADCFYFPDIHTTMTFLVNYGTDSESSLRPVFFEFREELYDLIYQ